MFLCPIRIRFAMLDFPVADPIRFRFHSVMSKFANPILIRYLFENIRYFQVVKILI